MAVNLPYFDTALRLLEQDNYDFIQAFSRHVHYGYWADPRIAKCTSQDYATAAEMMSDQVISMASVDSASNVLDVGCGFGGTIASINERLSGHSLVGLNIDERQLARARNQVFPLNSNTVEFVEGDACQLPFPDQSFDLVMAVECIFHFPSRERFFQEAFRVLKPGGRLFVSDIIPSRALQSLSFLVLPWLGPELTKSFGEADYRYTLSAYEQLGRRYNFDSFRYRNVTRETQPTHSVCRKIYRDNAKHDYTSQQRLQMYILEWLGYARLMSYMLMTWQRHSG